MIRRFLQSRAAGKFRRNRQAMVALGVIAVYMVIGLAALGADLVSMVGKALGGDGLNPNSVVGMLTLASAEQEVASAQVPPARVRAEAREAPPRRPLLRDPVQEDPQSRGTRGTPVAWRLDPALTWETAEGMTVLQALREVRFAERRLKDASLADIRRELDEADKLAEKLESSGDLDTDPSLAPVLEEFSRKVTALFAPMSALESARYWVRMAAGTDRQGRSVLVRGLYAIKVAFQVGFVVATLSVLIGSLVGAAAAYYGSWVDHVVVWMYSTLSSVPDLVLLAVLVFMFTGSIFDDISKPYLSLVPLYAAMSMTFWIGPCRVVRGETMKIKQLEYVQAATAIGFGRFRILLRHVLPNTVT